jgi:hypothetical protein
MAIFLEAASDAGYASHAQIIATAIAALAIVASQPITCIGSGRVKPAMVDRRLVRSIIVSITGTATTLFSTALQ